MEVDSQAMDGYQITLKSGETVFRFSCSDQSTEDQSMFQNSSSSAVCCAASGINFTNSAQPSREQPYVISRQYCSIGTQTDTPESACSVQTECDPTKNYSSTGTETDLNAIGDRKTLQTLLKWALSICNSEDSTPLIIPRFQEEDIQSEDICVQSSLLNLEHVHRKEKIRHESRKHITDIESDGARMTTGVTTNGNNYATFKDELKMSLEDQGASQRLHQNLANSLDIAPIDTERSFEPLYDCIGAGQTGIEDQACDDSGGCVFVDHDCGVDTDADDKDGGNIDDGGDDDGGVDVGVDGDVSGLRTNLFDTSSRPKHFKRHNSLHNNLHSGKKPYHCTICEKKFPSRKSMKYHIHRSHKETTPHECHLCKKRFASEGHLKCHLTYHKEGDKGPYKCDKCDKTFHQEDKLTKHMNTHNWFNCQICKKPFPCKSALDLHTVIHSRERPFKCNVCSKRFRRHDTLKEHSLTHTGEKPYKCQECDQTFRTRSGRWCHFQSSHLEDKN